MYELVGKAQTVIRKYLIKKNHEVALDDHLFPMVRSERCGCGMCRSLVVSPIHCLFSTIIPANDASPVTSHNKQLTDIIILPDLLTQEHLDSQRPQLFTIHADEANPDPFGLIRQGVCIPMIADMNGETVPPQPTRSLIQFPTAKKRSGKLHQS